MADERRHDHVQLTVDGQPLAADLYPLLTLVRVEESVQLPDSFHLRFDDPHFELFDRRLFTIGSRVEIGFRAEADLVVVTAGEITAIGVEQAGAGRHELVLDGLDVTHRLARGPKTRSFVQMTDADIAAQVARDHGLEPDIDPTGEVNEYVLQASQSDLAFLTDRANRIGFDLWITGETLHYKPRPTAAGQPPPLTWGDTLHKFKVRLASSDRCDEVTVRGWDPLAARVIVGRATGGDAGTDAAAADDLASGARQAFGETTRFAGQFPVGSQSAADALARSLLLRASGGEVTVKGEAAGDPRIAAGAGIAIENVGQRLSGRYRLTSVEHVYGAGAPYVTRFTCGGKDAATLADLVGGAGASSGGARQRGWGGGLAIGIVTNCDDPERLGRVKVKFPTLSDDDESNWARLAAAGAGAGRGVLCIPEVGDEVLVGFELGDPERPVVIGGLWNRQATPPAVAVERGEVTGRHWTSRDGHTLFLDDGGSGRAVLAHGGGDVKLELERDRAGIDGGRNLDLQADEITLEAGTRLVLRAPSIEIDGSADVTVTAGMIRLN